MATKSCPLQPASSLAEPRCGHAPCSIHSLFQPPSPADVTSDLQDHNQQEQLLNSMQQQQQEEEPTRTQSRGKLSRSPLSSAASSSEEEEDSRSATAASPSGGRSGGSSSACHERQPQTASTSAQAWEWLPQPPPPLPLPLQPPPSVRPQALAAAPPLSMAGSSVSSLDAAGSSNSSGGGSSFGATVGGSLRDDHPGDDALGPARPQATSVATASIGVHFRTTQEMLFGQPQGLFKGYPVMRRGRGSWRPLR